MANLAILFLDLLGVQRMWADSGAGAVKARIDEFSDFILDQVNYLPGTLHREGEYNVILAGDSVSIICQEFDQAVGIGIHLMTQAFYTKKVSHPLWLRGAIGRWHNQYLTVNTHAVQAKGIHIGTQYVNEDDYLAVLALEKSGFRGMRLIVESAILNNHGRDFQVEWDDRFSRCLGYVSHVKGLCYPADGADKYADVLWMASVDRKRYEDLKGIMAQRFKRAADDAQEFAQAAWTRALFDGVDTLVWQCEHPKALVPVAADAGVLIPQAHAPQMPVD
jgi:hypothetical protein